MSRREWPAVGKEVRMVSNKGSGVKLGCAGLVAVSAWACCVSASEPAPVNPYRGMQVRREVFEFAEKPEVRKEGDKYVITFAARDYCDAAVWVEDASGRVVAHVGAGVLGKNAPWPFRQGSLSQRVVWDGRDDEGRPVVGAFRIKVGLGLQAVFGRNIAYDPYNFRGKRKRETFHVRFKDGSVCVVGASAGVIRLFDRSGRYVRTLAPHSARVPRDRLDGFLWLKTVYGDYVPVPPGRGWRHTFHGEFTARGTKFYADPKRGVVVVAVGRRKKTVYYAVDRTGSFKVVDKPAPEPMKPGTGGLPAPSVAPEATYGVQPRIEADPFREEVYVAWQGGHVCSKGIYRYNGVTGVLDKSWPASMGAEEIEVGPGGMVYARCGSYGRFIVRLDHSARVVPFKYGRKLEKGYNNLPSYLNKYRGSVSGIFTGGTNGSNVQQKGFAVSPSGRMYVHVQYVLEEWAKKHVPSWKKSGKRGPALLVVFDADGKLLCPDALPGMDGGSHGLGVDRWGNVYKGIRNLLPAGLKYGEGIAPGQSLPPGKPGWGRLVPVGSVVKFRGGRFPVGRFVRGRRAASGGVRLGRSAVAEGALWAYGGMSPLGGSACSCNHSRMDVDPYGRVYVPQTHTCSVVVIDGNGNKVLRVGRYGNVDDDGIRFAWVRAVAATDRALYVLDYGNRRILRADLKYAAVEEAVTSR